MHTVLARRRQPVLCADCDAEWKDTRSLLHQTESFTEKAVFRELTCKRGPCEVDRRCSW